MKAKSMMVSFKVMKMGDVFDTSKRKMLVNEAYERYAQSYLQLTFAHKENKLQWRKKPVEPLTVSLIHHKPQAEGGISPLSDRFQGWCVIDRTSAEVVKIIPFAEQVPAANIAMTTLLYYSHIGRAFILIGRLYLLTTHGRSSHSIARWRPS